ncbi:hypothetical protein BP6252_13358 [Coleophoma cylindrospora]|uniref:NADP-dependent oxidoreductase domain-containing protein n=1 Tax=Coleophoma cylindrospora TaxID=1849047 RepID=A0A3D8QAK9_9HELO|nr:hypothetical protein BP6252_13358 [Coleophoma cylindrospora]
MSYGSSQWEGSPWVLDEAEALPLLKKAYDVGINTWDTANTYSNGVSETIIGKALQEYSIPREKLVILTKLYYPVLEGSEARPNPAVNDGELTNQMGLSRKHIFDAVDGSLRRLKTTYIDVLQLHRLDREVEPEEIMKALHDLVEAGKVRYIGASSMYCWEFARLQYTAKLNHWTTFISMQPFYNLLYREEEREMIPFCNATGVGIIPWSPLARGLLTRPLGEQSQRSAQDKKAEKWFSQANLEIVTRVEEISKAKGCSMADLATAWVLSKGMCPIVGLGSEKRIESVMSALSVEISELEMNALEELYRPMNVTGM